MDNLLTGLLSITDWTLCAMIALPVLLAVLAFLFGKFDGIRNTIIWTAVTVVLAGGLLLVWQTFAGPEPGRVYTLTAPAKFANIGFILESAVLLAILCVAIKIRHIWITVFAIAQAALAVGAHFIHGGVPEPETLVLFRVDNLARILLIVTSVVGSVILIFSMGYMKEHVKHLPKKQEGPVTLFPLGAVKQAVMPESACGDSRPGSLGRFYFFFISFLGFMIGLVVSDNFSFFSCFWEATTLCSYALIGQDGGEARRVNATRALLINSFGGVLLLTGIFMLKFNGCGEDFSSMFAQKASFTLLPAVCLCVAAFTKSALFPFQSWLLGAMVAPTPVSALLHAATMVKAGVYLVMRISPNYSGDKSFMMMVAFAGAFSFAGAAFLACTQSNGKKVLAYSTISNLGLVVACAGIESPLAYAAGLSIITFHALSKGLLFLCVGRIEQKIGSRDIEDMDGMPFKMFFTTTVAMIGMMSMVLPPFGMLLSKWLAIEATMRSPFLLVFLVLGSALTVYFWAKWIGRMQLTGYHPHTPHEEVPPTMRISLSILAVLIIVSGVFTMMIFSEIFTGMAAKAFPNFSGEVLAMSEQASFPAYLVLSCLGLGLLAFCVCGFFGIKSSDVRPPFLCGENVIHADETEHHDGVKSYDFYSLAGKPEHAVFSSYYFSGLINEKRVTRCFNWVGWLVVIVMLGCAVAAIR